ncbi:MAG: hypothetical protein K0S54_3699 [Alphaproteobacteria bacterium]|nr:hypothetical protein [Alphaproteobacteria bacterium]
MAVDRLRGSLSTVAIKAPVRAASTGNLTLSGLQTIDGVALNEGDRVLVKDQADARLNGIWLAAPSAWKRAADFNGSGDAVEGTQLVANEGNTQSNFRYKVSSPDPVVIGIDTIGFQQISDGPAGPQGPAGATGATGAAGPQGPAGASGSGSGDVNGPASVTGNTVALWDGDSGDLLKQGPALGNLAALDAVGAAQISDGSVGVAELGNAAKVFDIPFNAGFDASLNGEDLAVKSYGTLVLTRNVVFEGEVGHLETAATGAAAIVDIEKNGATLYSSAKPQFAAGSNSLSAGTLTTTTGNAGDRLAFKITQVGSSIKGQRLRFGLKCRLS